MYSAAMGSLADKLADVTQRVAESERRIAEQQDRISRAACHEAIEAAALIYMTANLLKQLRACKHRLEREIGTSARTGDEPEQN